MRCMKPLPLVIQGGMGVGVSSWQLARTVSRQGMLGVVSGTVIDGVLARRLQQGDPDGHMRRALAAFPCPDTAREVLDRWFVEGGLPADKPYERVSMPTLKMSPDRLKLMVVSGFVEVWLARERASTTFHLDASFRSSSLRSPATAPARYRLARCAS